MNTFLTAYQQNGLLNYLIHSWPVLLHLGWQHLQLVGSAVGMAILVGVPLGMLLTVCRWLVGPVLIAATILLTIPSLALIGLMIPFFSLFNNGLGPLPAITAVFLYSLLPIVRNTFLAFDSIDGGIREAGTGIGMTAWQRMRLVDLPLALPVVIGGVRTAAVLNIGVMTVGGVVGAGGLGVLILQAISQSNVQKLVVGAALVSFMALCVDLALARLQRWLTPAGLGKSS